MVLQRVLMDAAQMKRAIRRLAHQLLESIDCQDMVLVGVRTGGTACPPLALHHSGCRGR